MDLRINDQPEICNRISRLLFSGPTTLDYPLRGSVEIGLPEEEMPEATESLSADTNSEDVENEEDAANPERR
jgi:hypothetical protein